jgi:hypothetical protein
MKPTGQTTGRPAKILARFPNFMRAEQPGKALGEVAVALGKDLDEAERMMTAIQQSHRLSAASEERDVLQLASLLGLERADFFILRKFYEKGFFRLEIQKAATEQEREERAYAAYLAELKDSVRRITSIMLDGCGTIHALLEGAAILVNADAVGAVEHTDANEPQGGFIHRLPVSYPLVENGRRITRRGYISLVENPIVDRESEEMERRQRQYFRVRRRGFFDGNVTVLIRGTANRTVKPLIVNRSTHEGIGFRGVVADGQTLAFTPDGKARLDGQDVTKSCFYFRGALADDSTFESGAAKDALCVVKPQGSLSRNFPRPSIVTLAKLPLLMLRLGESIWRFSVEEGAYDASAFDEAVFALPVDDEARNNLPASGRVNLKWREHEPFSVLVLLPADLKALENSLLRELDLREMVRAGLERFRTAGVSVGVDYFDEKWIKDRNIIKA